MAAASLAMPTKLWDSAGRECGRTFLYNLLHTAVFYTQKAFKHRKLLHTASVYTHTQSIV